MGVKVTKNKLVEIRMHGRGGQGAVTSAELLARAAIAEGKYAQAFPSFGPERRGAPVMAFVRIDNEQPVKIRGEITEPDIVVVLDPTLLGIIKVSSGLKNKGTLVLNTKKTGEQIQADFGEGYRLAIVDASRIARETLGVPITNTTMVGALLKATGVVKLESLVGPLTQRFGRMAEKNIEAMKKAYEETLVKE